MIKALKWLSILLLIAAIVIGLYYRSDSAERIDALKTGGTLITTDAGVIEYELVGSGEGDVLLFFHGTPGGYDQGIGAIPGAQVLTLSRPGYLGTPLATGATPTAQANAANALLDALDIGKVTVMGASGGGPAAYTFARQFPERTVGLIAMEAISQSVPADELGLPGSDLAFWLMIQSLVLTQDDAGVVEQIARNPSDRARLAEQPERQREVAGMIWSMWPPSMRKEGFDNDFTQFQNLNLELSSIQVPTLIIHGTKDQSVPYSHAEYAASQIPGATLHTIEGAGHMMPFAHEEEVTGAVNDFLEKIAAPTP